MIVLDEQISRESLQRSLDWYPGQVIFLKQLRPGRVIKDDAVPTLLRQARQPTFVAINVEDFWRRVPVARRYCIVCFLLPDERVKEIPDLLRRLFRLTAFKTKAARMGKMARISTTQVRYYEVGDASIQVIPLEDG